MTLVSVMVPATLIEDGETLPAVGRSVALALEFAEYDATYGHPGVMHLALVAEPQGGPVRNQPLGGEEHGDTIWPVLLRGDGWAASWSAPRPVSGPMTLQGALGATWDAVVGPEARISSRVLRVQVVSHTVEYTSVGDLGGTDQ